MQSTAVVEEKEQKEKEWEEKGGMELTPTKSKTADRPISYSVDWTVQFWLI